MHLSSNAECGAERRARQLPPARPVPTLKVEGQSTPKIINCDVIDVHTRAKMNIKFKVQVV